MKNSKLWTLSQKRSPSRGMHPAEGVTHLVSSLLVTFPSKWNIEVRYTLGVALSEREKLQLPRRSREVSVG